MQALLTSGCEAFTQAPSAEPDPYDVYGAVLRETILAEGFGGPPRHESEHRPIDRLVIIDHTDPDGSFFEVSDYVRREMPELDSTTIAAFATVERREPLERRFDGVGPCVLFTEQDRESIFPAGGWSEFYRRFPAAPGVIGLSGVGFGRGGTQAL